MSLVSHYANQLRGTLDNKMPRWEGSGSLTTTCLMERTRASMGKTRQILRSHVLRTATAAAVALLLLLSGLPIAFSEHSEAASKTTLKIGMLEPIDSLNPFIGVNDNAYIFYGLVYDYLMAVDQDLNIKPNLATSWFKVPLSDPDMVANGKPHGSVWQYNLTENAEWHDDEPFDADDVVFTFNYQIGVNYDSIWAFQPYTKFIQSIEKVDAYTVRIHFKDIAGNPAPFPGGDMLMMPIIPEHIWTEVTPFDAGFSYENYFPIGTGAFMCTERTMNEYLAGEHLILLRNPNYHGEVEYGQKVKFDRLILEFYLTPSAMLTDIQSGTIDLVGLSAPGYSNLINWLTSNPTEGIGTYAGLTCTGFSVELITCMNEGAVGANPLRLDHEVRKAMAHAIDKVFIRDYIYAGYAQTGSTILSSIYGDLFWSPEPDEAYDYNLTKANEILDAAGYVWNSQHTKRLAGPGNAYAVEGTPLRFIVTTEIELVEDRDTVNFLSEEWREIGIELVPNFVSSAEWGNIVYGGSYDLAMTYWSGDPDPNYLLFIQSRFALGGWSENWYSNPDYDDNYTKFASELDPETRKGYVYNCSKISYVDAAFIVTVYPFGTYAWRNDHFSGWGDWAAHPGRTLSSFWTANDLYFDLVPLEREETSMTFVWIGLGAALVAFVAVYLWFRKRGPKEEDIHLP